MTRPHPGGFRPLTRLLVTTPTHLLVGLCHTTSKETHILQVFIEKAGVQLFQISFSHS
uniref:Uncharacterized protein n=1 Tax=Heterorhabditis bacteriophora TaxID=37862 RepID=A0A1I7WSF4_HETBA